MPKYCSQSADCPSCANGVETDESYCGCCGLPLTTNPLTSTQADDKVADTKPKRAVFHIRFPEDATHEQVLSFLTELARVNAESGLNAEISNE